MLFRKHIPAPAEREPVSAEPEPAQAEENPFLDAANALEHAYEEAMAVMTEKLNARNALPKATRPNRAIAPTPDYQSLSSEAFRALERQIKAAVRDGKRITL